LKKPVKFERPSEKQSKVNIIDIVCGLNSIMALSDRNEVFVWGRKMGLYDMAIGALDHATAAAKGWFFSQEMNQNCPRLIKNNLAYHKISKIFGGFMNFGFITEKVDLFL